MEMTREELIHCWGADYFEHCFEHAQQIRRHCWQASQMTREMLSDEEEPPIDLILSVAIAETIQRVIIVSDRTSKNL